MGSSFIDPFDPVLRDDLLDPPKDVYFGVCLRAARSKIAGATVVWCDADKDIPEEWRPEPTVTVSSGRGVHAYWVLDRMIPAEYAVRMTKLATMAYAGDPKVCEQARTMRLPGTWNVKYTPPRMSKAERGSDAQYDPEHLEEHLAAAALAEFWEAGNRHSLTLCLAALLCRAGWDVDRAQRCVAILMEISGDQDTRDRVAAVTGTYERVERGEIVSATDLKDAMEAKAYKRLVEALGVTSRDGDVILDGERIGSQETLQESLVEYVLGSGEWGSLDGTLARWTGSVWQPVHKDYLATHVFKLLTRLREIKQGVETKFTATAALARAVSDMCSGQLSYTEVPEPGPYRVPVANGILDLLTGELLAHGREHHARWVLPVAYDPEATCPTWEAFLAEAAPNEAAFLQEWLGYCLMAGNPWQRMLWVFGPSGTGKSTFLQAVSDLFGPACVPVKSGKLDDYSVASLAPSRVAVCSELSTRLLQTASLKALVASDPVVGRHPYGRPFQVVFKGKFVWASNALPPVDQSEGLWRRIVVVPFVTVPKSVNPLISEEIRGEMAGVLNWALEGLRRVQEYIRTRDWPLPLAVTETVAEYRSAADTFAAFARDELVIDEAGEIPARDLYKRYAWWAKDRGYQPEPFGPTFWRELRKSGMEPVDNPKMVGGRLTRVWRGAKLAPEAFG